MKINLNVCQIHNDNYELICENCKVFICQKCCNASHNDHKTFIFSKNLMDSYEFLSFLERSSNDFTLLGRQCTSQLKFAIEYKDVIDEEMLDQVECEIKTLYLLDNSNIIKYHSANFFKKEKKVVYLMEPFDVSLNNNIFQNLDKKIAIKYFKDICHGLNYLHQNHLVYKNFNPTNIVIQNNVAKLKDFGMSKSNSSMFISYASPEIIKGGKYSEYSDVWAAGIIFHQLLLNGSHIFESKDEKQDIKAKILDEQIQIDPELTKFKKFDKIIRGIDII